MIKVTNAHNKEIDFDAAQVLMDEEITERLNRESDMETEQMYFETYCAAHLAKYGEEFEPSKANPVW